MPDIIGRVQAVTLTGQVTSGQTMSDRLGKVETEFDKLSADVANTVNQQTDAIEAQSEVITELNTSDAFKLIGNPLSQTKNGITWTWNDDKTEVTVNGTSTSASINAIFASSTTLPPFFEVGHYYPIKFNGANVKLVFLVYTGGTYSQVDIFHDDSLFVPLNATGLTCRLVVSAGLTVDERIKAPVIGNAYSAQDISNVLRSKLNMGCGVFTDEQCVDAFVAEMNKTKSIMGFSDDSIFYTPSGLPKGENTSGIVNLCTMNDLCILGNRLTNYPMIVDAMSVNNDIDIDMLTGNNFAASSSTYYAARTYIDTETYTYIATSVHSINNDHVKIVYLNGDEVIYEASNIVEKNNDITNFVTHTTDGLKLFVDIDKVRVIENGGGVVYYPRVFFKYTYSASAEKDPDHRVKSEFYLACIKGGSLKTSDANDHYKRAQLAIIYIAGEAYILCIQTSKLLSSEEIFTGMHELCKIIRGDSFTPRTLVDIINDGGSYAYTKLRLCNMNCTPYYTPAHVDGDERNGFEEVPIWSVSKVLTAIVACDNIIDRNMVIEVKKNDYSATTSGHNFIVGDKIKFCDALRVLMMESSNTIANAIARTVGKIILESNVRK